MRKIIKRVVALQPLEKIPIMCRENYSSVFINVSMKNMIFLGILLFFSRTFAILPGQVSKYER
jgi:hypothetical protein